MEPLTGDEERARVSLAEGLERRRDDIIERWLTRVREHAGTEQVPPTALIDGIGDYLTRLQELLRGNRKLDGDGASVWNDVTREHAITRVKLGFDVLELGHELVVLRQVVTQVLIDDRLLHDIDQVARITDLIEAAMTASIQSYVEHRDYETRRSEAEHIGFLTHELRNPLGAVAMAASHLRRDAKPEQRRLFDILDRNIERLQHLISDVLLTERLEIGEVESQPVDVKLGALIADLVEMFQQVARRKGLEFRATFDPEIELRADPKLTMSALENLLDNALKFTDDGEVTLDIEELPNETVFHVRDHCAGLSAQELRVIFEPFRRAHTNKPGTGLGLAIARRAVEAQGGKIDAESTIDTGCHFWFTLPKTHH